MVAHQSGGLGVVGSNPAAPTNEIKKLSGISLPVISLWEALGNQAGGVPQITPSRAVMRRWL
jgi:hypothetical protein